MKRIQASLCAVVLSTASALFAQSSSSSLTLIDYLDGAGGGAVHRAYTEPSVTRSGGPLSRFAVGGGISSLGINVSAATNLSRYLNIRGTGNVFNYTVNNISSNGFNVGAKLDMSSAGTALDLYPFPNHGFRVSPGVMFYNQNAANATFNVAGGTSFTLNKQTFYASSSNPISGTGSLNLHKQNPAFTATTGWGNMVGPHGHLSFPVEIGAAFVGPPALNIALTSGQVCDLSGLNCMDIATDANVQANLQAQVAKYQNDLNPLKIYPILSFGVAYSINTRSAR